jgi:hypothetical protein
METLLKIKEHYFAGRKIILNKGDLVRFWIDPWLNNTHLFEAFPALFDICQRHDWTFEKVLNSQKKGCYLTWWYNGTLSSPPLFLALTQVFRMYLPGACVLMMRSLLNLFIST